MLEELQIYDTGDTVVDNLLFAASAIVTLGAVLIGWHALNEKLRRLDTYKPNEIDI